MIDPPSCWRRNDYGSYQLTFTDPVRFLIRLTADSE
jgi:hypothetical protein